MLFLWKVATYSSETGLYLVPLQLRDHELFPVTTTGITLNGTTNFWIEKVEKTIKLFYQLWTYPVVHGLEGEHSAEHKPSVHTNPPPYSELSSHNLTQNPEEHVEYSEQIDSI